MLFAPYLYHFITNVRGLTLVEFALLQSFYYCVAVSLEIPSGVLADRLGRKHTLVAGALLAMAGSCIRILAFDFWVFALAEFCFASALALVSGADSALLYDSLAADGRSHEYARYEGLVQAVWLGFGAAGMLLTDAFLIIDGDPTLAFVAHATLAGISTLFALAMKEPPIGQRLSTREITVGVMRDVIHVPGILRLLAYSAGIFILLRAAIILFFNPVLESKGIPVHFYGTALATVNVIGAIAAWQSHAIMARIGERLFLFAMPAALVAMYLLLIPADAPIAVALFCVQGAVIGAYPTAVRTMLNRLVPQAARRATTLSVESMACRLIYAVVVVLLGWSLEAFTLAQALLISVSIGCLPFMLMALLQRENPATKRA